MHGFKNVIFIGDSGGNQNGQKAVADTLTAQWAGAAFVATIPEHYTAPPGTPNVLRQLGVTKDGMPDDGLHDSPGITLNMMLTDPKSVRWDERVKAGKATINGVSIADKDQVARMGQRHRRSPREPHGGADQEGDRGRTEAGTATQ